MDGADSCYSWVVVSASSFIFLLVSCPARLGAQIFVSLLDRYDTSRKEASVPFVLAQFLRGASGPFAGALGEKIGLQGVTILGCLLCAIGVGGCFFAEDLFTIDICFGVIFGIGYGWSLALIPEILNQHFKKHRSKAYGIFLSGGGLGSFLIPPILDLLLKHFGLSGTFLIMAAMILNSVPAAMLLTKRIKVKKKSNFLPLLDSKCSHKIHVNEIENRRTSSNAAANGMFTSVKKFPESCEFDLLSDHQLDHENSKIQLKNVKKEKCIENQATDVKNRIAGMENHFSDRKNHVTDVRNYVANTENHISDMKNNFTDVKISGRENRGNINLDKEVKSNSIYELGGGESPLNKQQVLDGYFVTNEKYTELNLKDKCFKPPKKSLFSKFSILWSPEFLTIALAQAVCALVNQVFWTIMVDFVRDKGIEQYLEVYFVMSLSLFDTIGRFILGSITDKGLMTMKNFTVCSFVVTGFIFVLLAWLPEFFSIMTAISLMGLTFGGITIAMPALITKFIRKDKRSIAMASRLLVAAPLCLTISPLIGFFRGTLGSFDGLLYVMASMCAVCVIMLQLLPMLAKRRNRVQLKEIT